MRLNDSESFKNYFRMTPNTFEELLSVVGPVIQKKDTRFRQSISAKERLQLTLRYLASGDSMASLSFSFRIARTTVSRIIFDTCSAISRVISQQVLVIPDTEGWRKIAKSFNEKWQFPHCLGAIDGKHVAIQAPAKTGSMHFNYKGYFSIILLAVADASYRFIVVDIGSSGHQSDGSVFRNSVFGRALHEGSLNIPSDAVLPGSRNTAPFVFVADEAFPLQNNLMRPYPGHSLPVEHLIFNYRLSRARRCVENAFGIMAARFRIFRKPIAASLATTRSIVKAAVCLHNYLRQSEGNVLENERCYCPQGFVDSEDERGNFVPGTWRDENPPALNRIQRVGSNTFSKHAAAVRSNFTAHFMEDAAVPWQVNHVTATQ